MTKKINGTLTSQVQLYLGSGGWTWNIPLSKQEIIECLPTEYPSTGNNIEDSADLLELIVLYDLFKSSNYSVRKSQTLIRSRAGGT